MLKRGWSTLVREWGFYRGEQKGKILEIKGCGGYFTRLEVFRGGFMVGCKGFGGLESLIS